jgi:hypothetical protein
MGSASMGADLKEGLLRLVSTLEVTAGHLRTLVLARLADFQGPDPQVVVIHGLKYSKP